MVEAKEVLAFFMREPVEFAHNIDNLLRSELLQSNDRSVLVAIKRNIELGMASTEIRRRLQEIGNTSPQLVALLVAYSVYNFYNKN